METRIMLRAMMFSVLAVVPFALARPAAAVPLDADACGKAKAEREKLAADGAVSDMQQGAVWAKTNLPVEKLTRIARLIELDEQLLFRCPRSKVARAAPQDGTVFPKAGATGTKPVLPAEAATDGARKPKGKRTRKPKQSTEGENFIDALTGSNTQQAAPQPPAKSSKKATSTDDAYKGPPTSFLPANQGAAPQ